MGGSAGCVRPTSYREPPQAAGKPARRRTGGRSAPRRSRPRTGAARLRYADHSSKAGDDRASLRAPHAATPRTPGRRGRAIEALSTNRQSATARAIRSAN
ncbi:hypothetical protein AQ477_12720 [Burkholderia thailandensis]|nr:hypothetical protein AQ477_12720 [Burkholderia thailandensis]KXF61841.1 hypothetical protein AQ476_11400 [Burkholderia thailandensis]